MSPSWLFDQREKGHHRRRRTTGPSPRRRLPESSQGIEWLEPRVLLADLSYHALNPTPLTLRLSGTDVQVVDTDHPDTDILAAMPLANID